MKSTTATRSLKKLFAGYHEPAPLSAQQSQKLLDSLKVSFRDQLDREYGRSSTTASSTTDDGKGLVPTQGYRRSAANQHLKNLLSNPLFSYKTSDMSGPSLSNANKHAKTVRSKPLSGQENEPAPIIPPSFPMVKRDPMDVFDHAVSRGMMNLQRATGCLLAKRQLADSMAETFPQLSGTGTGLRVVRWLRSSRPENDLAFLDRKPFMNVLMPFLVSEGLDKVVWEWIERTVSDANLGLKGEHRQGRAAYLLNLLVQVKGEPQNGDLDEAMATLLQAEDLLHSNNRLSKIMLTPWRSVSWLSTVESQTRMKPSEKLFDAHIAAAGCLHHSLDIEQAHLQLYHPTHADDALALRFFENKQKIQKIIQDIAPDKWQNSLTAMGKVRWMTVLGQDTVRFLTRAGKVDEAQRVANMVLSELAPFANAPNPT